MGAHHLNGLLIVAILLISTAPLYAQRQQQNVAKLKADARDLAIIIAASTTVAQGQSLQEQANCAQQAKAAFQEYKGGAPPGSSDYQSHYNKTLNKCFGFASYIQLTKEGKEYLVNCELKPTAQEKETICSSKQKFDAFVSKYMEQ